jgi:hypothetical protein
VTRDAYSSGNVSSGPGGSAGAGADGGAGVSPSVSMSKREEGGSSDGDGGASGAGDGRGGDDARSGADDSAGAGSGAGVGSSADASGLDRGAITGAATGGGSFAGGVFGSKGGGSVGVLTWSRIEDDSSGIEDDSPGLGARSNDEISLVVGDGGGSANARAWLPSPILGPSSSKPTSAPTNTSRRMGVSFNCVFRNEPIEVEPKTNLAVNPGHA